MLSTARQLRKLRSTPVTESRKLDELPKLGSIPAHRPSAESPFIPLRFFKPTTRKFQPKNSRSKVDHLFVQDTAIWKRMEGKFWCSAIGFRITVGCVELVNVSLSSKQRLAILMFVIVSVIISWFAGSQHIINLQQRYGFRTILIGNAVLQGMLLITQAVTLQWMTLSLPTETLRPYMLGQGTVITGLNCLFYVSLFSIIVIRWVRATVIAISHLLLTFIFAFILYFPRLEVSMVIWNMMISFIIIGSSAMTSRTIENATNTLHRIGMSFHRECQRHEKVLTDHLPHEIIQQLREQQQAAWITGDPSVQQIQKQQVGVVEVPECVIANGFPNVTVLFCYIADFSTIVSERTSESLVALINRVFTELDGLINNRPVYKVEALVETYLVVGGCPIADPKHALNVCELALAMIGKATLGALGRHIRLKIGIHSGPIVAGFVGRSASKYQLFGDTMNTASRMCSTCPPNHVQISSSTYELVKNYSQFKLTERGAIQIKGKGIITTYYVAATESTVDALVSPLSIQTPSLQGHFTFGSPQVRPKTISWQDPVINNQLNLILESNHVGYSSSDNDNNNDDGDTSSSSNNNDFIASPSDSIPAIIFCVTFLCIPYNNNKFEQSSYLIGCQLMMHFALVGLGIVITIVRTHQLAYALQVAYLQQSVRKQERKMYQGLLNRILPHPALAQPLLRGRQVVTNLADVTFLHSDLVNFTALCGILNPEEVIQLLNELYSIFDTHLEQHGVHKIDTIGDAFVAVGGLFPHSSERVSPRESANREEILESSEDNISSTPPLFSRPNSVGFSGPNHVNQVLLFALDMMKALEQLKRQSDHHILAKARTHGMELELRIGIHTGKGVGAFLGTKRPRFTVWGHDTLVSQKLESTGTPGCIHISADTLKLCSLDLSTLGLNASYKGVIELSDDNSFLVRTCLLQPSSV